MKIMRTVGAARELRRAPFGIKAFLGVWLLVLLVPTLRLRARFALAPQPSPRDKIVFNADELNAARLAARFPDDATAQKSALDAAVYEAEAQRLSNAQPNADEIRSESDPRIAPVPVAASNAGNLLKQRIAGLNALIERFPRENWLRADQLRLYTTGGMNIEPPDPSVNTNVNNGAIREPWLSLAELLQMRDCARAGAVQEPNNAFYPWMEALAEFAQRNHTGGVAALERAGHCTSYNDEAMSSTRRRLELLERVRPLQWEERAFISAATLLPHFAPMRSATRAACFQAKAAMKRGDTSEALRIYGAAMKAARPVRQNSDILLGVVVGEAMEAAVWQHALRAAKLPSSNQRVDEMSETLTSAEKHARQTRLAHDFGRFASAHGRSDLAARANADAQSFQRTQLSDFYALDDGWPLGMARTRAIVQGTWLEGWLLRLSFAGALSWLACVLGLRYAARFARVPRVRRGPMAGLVAFMSGATLALLGIYLWQGAGNWLYNTELTGEAERQTWLSLAEPNAPLLLGALWCAPVVLASLQFWMRARRALRRGASTSAQTLEIERADAGAWALLAGVAARGRMAAGALVVGSSLLYGALTLSLCPWRAQTNAMQRHEITIGEVAYVQERLAQSK